eukprot:188282-Chlamydomonas_euryale.AAC.1
MAGRVARTHRVTAERLARIQTCRSVNTLQPSALPLRERAQELPQQLPSGARKAAVAVTAAVAVVDAAGTDAAYRDVMNAHVASTTATAKSAIDVS